MPVNSIISDYTGRKKDLSILQNPDASLVGAQTVTPSFGAPSRFCAGIQKLIQRYAIILLTNLESQQNYPEFGTRFIATLSTNSSIDRILARQIFTLANAIAVKTLQNYQIKNKNIPNDERIDSATLRNIVVVPSLGSVSFDIAITSEAGQTVDFLLPLPK
jgi:hypothetical protein